jgi:hypothetical protein
MFVEDELFSSRLWSRVSTAPSLLSPSSLSIYGEGRRSRSDSLSLYGREHHLLRPSLSIEDELLLLDGRE